MLYDPTSNRGLNRPTTVGPLLTHPLPLPSDSETALRHGAEASLMEMQSADPVRALVAILIKNVVKKASDVCHAVPEVARERLRLALMHVDALPVASVAGHAHR